MEEVNSLLCMHYRVNYTKDYFDILVVSFILRSKLVITRRMHRHREKKIMEKI